MSDPIPRVCREVQAHLPGVVAGALPRWRTRLVELHLRRCELCAGELERQQALAAGLGYLGAAAADVPVAPPAGLLDTLLDQAEQPGLRARAAVPARGAVSGARPGLSAALLLAGAALGTAAGWTAWRIARRLTRRR